MSPFSDFSKQFLVAAYLENQRIGDAVESGLIARSYDLKFGPNWIVRVVEGAIKQGWMAGSVNAGGDEYQVIYLTGAGMAEAERLIGQGIEVTWHGVTIEGKVTTIDTDQRIVKFDHNSEEFLRIRSGLADLRHVIESADEIETSERSRLLSSLSAADALMDAAQLKVIQVRVGVIMVIEDALAALGKTTKALTFALLVDGVKALVKAKTGFDLDTLN
jgi:hypothetical protein